MRAGIQSGWTTTPTVKKIIIINAVIWAVELFTVYWLETLEPIKLFAVTPNDVFSNLRVWQPFTYMWLHSVDDMLHILLNMLFLWMFGCTLESRWGKRGFLRFYLYCGIGAGLTVIASGILLAPDTPVLGASGAVYGLVAAWAIMYPNQVIYFFGIIPMKGKHFVLIPIGFAVFDFLTRSKGVSHAAHLGGMAVGALLVTGYWRPDKLKNRLRYWYLRRKLTVYEGKKTGSPPGGGYWH